MSHSPYDDPRPLPPPAPIDHNPDRISNGANGCLITFLIVAFVFVIGPAVGWFIAQVLQLLFIAR